MKFVLGAIIISNPTYEISLGTILDKDDIPISDLFCVSITSTDELFIIHFDLFYYGLICKGWDYIWNKLGNVFKLNKSQEKKDDNE